MKPSFANLTSLGRGCMHAAFCTWVLAASAQPSSTPPAQAAASQPNATAEPPKSATPVRITQPGPSPLLTDRLFFSEDERARLDRARARGVSTDELDAGISLAPTLDGVMRQVGGRTTYWINGTPRVVAPRARDPIVPNAMIGPELKAKVVDATTAPNADAKSPRRAARDTPRAPSRENPAR
ncbi:MAG: hypothetical protein ACK5UX_01740 [Burkholderiales bacterium]